MAERAGSVGAGVGMFACGIVCVFRIVRACLHVCSVCPCCSCVSDTARFVDIWFILLVSSHSIDEHQVVSLALP